MSNDPKRNPSGPYDQTVPMSPSYPPQGQQPFNNQQVPNYGLPNQGMPPQPNNGVPAQSSRTPFIIAAGAIVAIVVIVVGAAILGQMFNSYNSVVSKYYGAVQQQNYTQAYSYISLPGAFNGQGVRLYTAIANGLDKANGPVTSYSEQSESGSGDNAVVVETVQRQSRSYTVHLTLIKINGEWKISNFSSI